MLKYCRLLSWPLVLLLILSPVLAHVALAAGVAASVEQVTGVVQVIHSGTTTRERLSTDDQLYAGDTVEVTRNSSLQIELANGSMIRFGPSTRVTIGSVDVRRTDLTTWYGSVLSAINRSGDDDYGYRVSTPTATASVRGTIFLTEVAEADGASTIQVLNGEVVTTSPAAPGEVVVTDGMKCSVLPGAAPSAPIALTAAELSALESLAGPFMEIGAAGAGAGAGAGAATGGVVAGSSSWWIWTIVGVVVAGGVTGGVILAGDDDGDGSGGGGGGDGDLPVPPPPPGY